MKCVCVFGNETEKNGLSLSIYFKVFVFSIIFFTYLVKYFLFLVKSHHFILHRVFLSLSI